MRKLPRTPVGLALFAALAAAAMLALLPWSVEARPVCPSDGIARTTSGSSATGADCEEALTRLAAQERPKMDCPHGLFSYEFVHNSCQWTGSMYQVTGWFEYECQTDCYGDPQ